MEEAFVESMTVGPRKILCGPRFGFHMLPSLLGIALPNTGGFLPPLGSAGALRALGTGAKKGPSASPLFDAKHWQRGKKKRQQADGINTLTTLNTLAMAIEGGVLEDPEGKFKRSKDVAFVARHRNPPANAQGNKGETYFLHDVKQVRGSQRHHRTHAEKQVGRRS